MNRFLLGAALALLSGRAAADVLVNVSLVAPDALQVTYTLPDTCARLSFTKDGVWAGKIRSRWQAQGDCGTADGNTLARGNASCQTLSFRVPASSNKVAGYPGSFPTGAAIYAHMSNYAVGPECGPVQYSYSSPGSIATGFRRHQGQAAADADAPALLFAARLPDAETDLDYFDSALSAQTVALIRDRARRTEAVLRAEMPKAHYRRPIVSATIAAEPGGPNIGGSAGDILHLALFNWPARETRTEARKLDLLVSHEMSHRFQIRDAVDDYPDERLIHEGAGEYLRWAVSLREGWLTPAEAAEDLDNALASCMMVIGDRSWREVSDVEKGANWLPYACGLPVYVYALANRQGKGSSYQRIDDFYAQLRAGHKPGFAQALECGAEPCNPLVLPGLLDKPGPMREQWLAVFKSTALAAPRAPNQGQTNSLMLRAITQWVKDDCGGRSSITPAETEGRLLVDSYQECQSVRRDIEVLRVEGYPVFGSLQALPALLKACSSRQSARLGLKDGSELALPCRTPYRGLTQVYAANMGKVMRALNLSAKARQRAL